MAGADVNHQANPGWTALQMAGTTGDTRTAELLLDAGADIDTQDAFGVNVRNATVLVLQRGWGCG